MVESRATTSTRAAWDDLAALLSYVSGDYREASTFAALADRLKGVDRPLYYLAIPPAMYDEVVEGLSAAGLAGPGSQWWSRKPSAATRRRRPS